MFQSLLNPLVARLQKQASVLFLVLAVTACANHPLPLMGSGSESPSEHVGEMARLRWHALVTKDFETAYLMMTPASRVIQRKDSYVIKAGLVKWLSATIGSVNCIDADICTVEVETQYSYNPPRIGLAIKNTQQLTETWRKVDGSWWYVPNSGS